MQQENKQIRFFITSANIVLIIAATVLFFKYLFSPLLPFVSAFILTAISKPINNYLVQKLSISKKLAGAMLTIILISLLSLLLYFATSRLLHETVTLAAFLADGGMTDILSLLSEKVYRFLTDIPVGAIDDTFAKNVSERIMNADKLLLKISGDFYPKIVEIIMKFLSVFPQAVIFTVLTFISMFYIGCDYEKIVAFINAQFSSKTGQFFNTLKNQFLTTVKDLFRAYLFLTIITFAELLTGFLILKVNYAILLAIVVSLIDMFPVLGTGTVLVPWSIISLILGDNTRAIGLLVLYGIITVFRQVLEPRIVGTSIGLSPLVTLICMYTGLRILGITGLFLFPVCAIIIKGLNDRGIIHLYKNPPKTDLQIIESTRKKYESIKNKKHK